MVSMIQRVNGRVPGRPSAHAHWLVRNTAVEMAHELYDTMMQDNEWYRTWKKQNPSLDREELETRFVERNLPRLLPQARATLAGMLTTSTDERLKEEIYQALILDATLVKGRA
jgi:hypothetical protein